MEGDNQYGEERRVAERRQDYCPVHFHQCRQMNGLDKKLDEQADSNEKQLRSKVPIWVLTIMIFIASAIIAYQLTMLREHIGSSDLVLGKVSHVLKEVSINQSRVLETLSLEYQKIPDMDDSVK